MTFDIRLTQKFCVYLDRTDDGIAIYVGKGNQNRVNQRYRNKKHKGISQNYGQQREVLFETDDEQEAYRLESQYVDQFETCLTDHPDNHFACNLTKGGVGGTHRVVSDTEREFHSQRMQGNTHGRLNRGQKRPNISRVQQGMKRSAQTCANISQAKRGKSPTPHEKVRELLRDKDVILQRLTNGELARDIRVEYDVSESTFQRRITRPAGLDLRSC